MANDLIEKDIQAIIDAGGTDADVTNYLKSSGVSYSEGESNQKTIANGDDFAQTIQPQNVLGQLFNVPGAAIRSSLEGKGYMQGATQPDQAPDFQKQLIDAAQNAGGASQSVGVNFLKGFIPSAVGLAGNIATNPADVLGMLVGKTPVGSGKNLGEVVAASKPGQAISKVANADITLKNDKLAGNVINSLIKPAHKQFMFGKNPGLGVAKEGITAGNLDELAGKVEGRLTELNQASQLIRNTPENINKTVDLSRINKPLIDSYLNLSKTPNVNKEQMANIRKVMGDLRQLNDGNLSKLSISDAYDIKSTVSKIQNWSIENKTGSDLNTSLRKVYGIIDKSIDNQIPELEQINSRMADLISAKKAISNRVEVLSKQEGGPSLMKLIDLPFAALRTTTGKTMLGKLLAKQYKSLGKTTK